MTVASGTSYCQSESFKNLLFSKLCVHKQCSQYSCSCVETLVILGAQFHLVLSLLTVLKIAILIIKVPIALPLKMSLI